jgi:hypothetical protein
MVNYTVPKASNYMKALLLRIKQGWTLVEIVGEVEKHLGEVQRSSSRPPWKVRA